MAYVAPALALIGRASGVVLGHRPFGKPDFVTPNCPIVTGLYDGPVCEVAGEW